MVLIETVPSDIYELDLNIFRLALKDIEDSSEGMPFVRTNKHSAPTTIGSISLARVIEIINGYTITFEDDQYTVKATGANSNLADVVNQNQVSVNTANSAGLIDIEYIVETIDGLLTRNQFIALK